MRARLLAVLAAMAVGPLPVEAQSAARPTLPAREPGSELIVYHVIMGQGDAVWEKFGHNALWIRDTVANTDIAYNWGVFDFESEDFIPRFLKGSMRYWVEAYPARPMLDAYVRSNRSIWTQELALTAAEKHALREFVRWNVQEEHKYYTYDYYRDNCSTRVRDALNRVLGGRLRGASDTIMTSTTWRWHTRRLTQGMPLTYAGIDIMLGQPTDRPISQWEEMFLPMRLQHHLRDFALVEEDGSMRKLVVREQQLFAADREPEPAEPPRPLAIFVITGAVLALLVVVSARAISSRSRLSRLALGWNLVVWPALFGLVGTLVLLTWLFTNHEAAFPNENLLQFSPLGLALAAAAPLAALRGRYRHGALVLAGLIAALSVAGFVLQVLPGLDQSNAAAIALAMPVNLALCWVLWRSAK